jgi:thiol-disulfide isomerase/thioredoxin
MTAFAPGKAPTVTRASVLIPALVYMALTAFANPASAQSLDASALADLAAMREGDMRKLVVHEGPVPAPDTAYEGPDGAQTTLAASNGRVRVVNFWATWCAPCREEMPALDALEHSLGGEDFEVLLIATGRNSPEGIARFLEEESIDLETGLDPRSALASSMNVPGLPVTVILDREGAEIARLMGGADWNGDSARAILARLIETP